MRAYRRLKHLIILPVFSIKKVLLICDPLDLPVGSTELVCSKLHKLDSYKSPGPNGWLLWDLKETANSLHIPSSIIYSRSLDTGVLPNGWKKDQVTPVYNYKYGGCNSLNNYWPITLNFVVDRNY